MKRIEFECICELAELMESYIENTSEDDYPIISAYAKYDEAKLLVETLIRLGNPIDGIIELEDYMMSHYNKEYIIYLTEDGINVEKIHHEDCYYYGGGDISFVHEDCSSKILDYIESKTIYEFGVGECDDEDYEEECDCDDCSCNYVDKDTDESESTHISRDEDGVPLGFNKTWSTTKDGVHCYSSYSHYNSNVDMLRSIASDFGVRL